MAAQWPRVKSWLAATIPTLPGLFDVVVYSGPPASDAAPARYVTVGFVTDDTGGSYQQAQVYDGTVWGEAGEIRSQIVANDGGSDPAVAEVAAFAIADALDAVIRADRTLGGTLSPDSSVDSSIEVLSISNTNGTATALVHVLHYTTTT